MKKEQKVTIGSVDAGLAGQFTTITNRVGEVESWIDGMSTTEYIDVLIERLNNEINATGGYTYIIEGIGIRTYDVAVSDPAVGTEASAVVEMRGGTIRIANTKDGQGDWIWETVFTSGHIAGNLVTAAEIMTGYIGSAGGTFIDLDNNIVQLGETTDNHMTVTANALDILHNTTQIAHFGYGEGNADGGGVGNSPYYTLGKRDTTASAYDATQTYALGDQVVYNDTMYVCMTPITSPEAWDSSHWEISVGNYSTAEGVNTVAAGTYSHAEGVFTTASGYASHAGGQFSVATGGESFAHGYTAKANKDFSVALGYRTIADDRAQTVIGSNNIADSSSLFIIGNGALNTSAPRSNALTVDWSGNMALAGSITASGSNFTVNTTSTANQIVTAGSGFTVSAASWTQCGQIASFYVTVSNTNALSANTIYNPIATLISGKHPAQYTSATFGTGASIYGNAQINTNGNIAIRPSASVSAGSTITIRATIIVA